MKKVNTKIISVVVVSLLAASFANAQMTRAAQSMDTIRNPALLQKSRDQRTVANVALIGGIAVGVVGGYLWLLSPIAGLSESGNVELARRTGIGMTIVGSSMIAISIPLFNASKRNKQKAYAYLGTGELIVPEGIRNEMKSGLRVSL